jgi:hypothetical protein
MRKFWGLVIFMGQVRKENIRDYWSTDPTISAPIFSHTMNRSHFESIGQPGILMTTNMGFRVAVQDLACI